MFQHTKGVVIALIVAVVSIFLLSLLLPSQLILEEEILIKQKQDSVYLYLKDAQQYQSWMRNLSNLKLENKKDGTIQFIGHDELLHEFKIQAFEQSKGIEIQYFKEQEKKAVLVFQLKAYQNETWLSHQQIWNLGYNPITKLIAIRSKEKSQENLKDELLRLKHILENK